MDTIKIAVCDDEQYVRSYLISLIQKQNYETEISEYASAEAYLSDTAEHDLLFLDIELGGPCPEHTAASNGQAGSSMENTAGPDEQSRSAPVNRVNGLELARMIRAADNSQQPLIIFVTGHESYVYDAFDVDAFRYLLKPIDEQRFTEVFRKAAQRTALRTKQQKKLVIQYAGTSRVLPLSDIYYMESQGHKIVLHLKDTTLEYYAKLGDLEQTLHGQFSRIHKGFLVNLSYVEEYGRAEVTLTNGVKLNVSKYKYDDFVKAHLRYMRSSD